MGAWEQGWALGAGAAQQRLAHKQALSDEEFQQHASLLGDELSNNRQILSTIDPQTNPEQYAAKVNDLRENLANLRTLYHPDRNPGAIGKFGHLLTDRLGLTDPQKRIALVASKRAAVAQGDEREAQELATATPDTPVPLLSLDELRKEARVKAGLEPRAAEPKPVGESFKTQNIVLADGRTITAQMDSKSGRWLDLNQDPIPRELLAGALLAKPKKGLKWDAATGEVIDQDSGKRYASAKDAPPEVAAMFSGAASLEARKQQFALKLASTRGAGYNLTKPLPVFDSANGNAPTYMTFGEMQKSPGRYVPAGPGAKAIASENLMQDIQGTSKLTRDAIVGLREDFPEEMKLKIAAAMRADDPHASLDQLIASGAVGSLTPDQQDFLIATRQLAENAMAMRQILGAGQGSEDMRDAIRQTLPGLLSPDRSFALRQLAAFDATVARLHRGVPKVKLNEPGAGGSAPPPGAEVIPWDKVQ